MYMFIFVFLKKSLASIMWLIELINDVKILKVKLLINIIKYSNSYVSLKVLKYQQQA